jgi:hypothetical protein
MLSLPSTSSVARSPCGERAAVERFGRGVLSFPRKGWFFFPLLPLDAHGNRAERARPCGGAALPASSRLWPGEFLLTFSFSLPSFF